MSPDFYNSLMSNCDSRDDPAGSNPECIPVSLEPQEIGKPLNGLLGDCCDLGEPIEIR